MKKRILVWPANTEIGLEIGHAFKGQTHFEVIGASSGPGPADHVFDTHLHFAVSANQYYVLDEWLKSIGLEFDFIYPAHDDATLYGGDIPIIGSAGGTSRTCRSKILTYYAVEDTVQCPAFFHHPDGLFKKPVFGQGSEGANVAASGSEFVSEYLPGSEFTIDCLTDRHGVLCYCQPRTRARIKSGITVETEFADRPDLVAMGEKINAAISLRGAWFFQIKERADGTPVLLEVGCRPAGSSGINRAIGVNLPLLAAYDACGIDIDVMPGKYTVSACRSLTTHFKTDLEFDTVYCDIDDTLFVGGEICPKMLAVLVQLFNEGKSIKFLTRGDGGGVYDSRVLNAGRLLGANIDLVPKGGKSEYISGKAIFIDDSHAERKEVHEATGIPVFSPQQAIDLWLK